MGMGDKKEPFVMKHKSIKCDVLNLEFADCLVRQCPHPGIIKKYGHNGTANVSYYTCQRCKYAVGFKFTGAMGCKYEMEFSKSPPTDKAE